ncbi:MAG: UTP--glucose-1-phosphate uridylyltransferase [Candidatus Cloacimonadota bacterium]|nr:MAG: UTP--glucose-1-phosphate uridylyltransferase [Candidatus Cloacimonadota bacterium]
MKIKTAVFPAAGLGTRFLPATKAQPKEMLPLVDKPMIQYVIEEAQKSGIEHVIIITGRGKNSIEDHFDMSYELERNLEEKGKTELLELVQSVSNMITISYVRQKEALGLGHAILCAKHLVGNEPFAVFLGDDIVDADVPCMAQMMKAWDKHQCSIIAVEQVSMEHVSSYGVIAGEKLEDRLYKISDMVEKPKREDAPSDLAIIGRYILTPEIFDILEKTQKGAGGEIQLTDGLRTLLKTQNFYGYQFEGNRYDTGSKMGFLKATVEFALKREDLGPEFREYLKTLDL